MFSNNIKIIKNILNEYESKIALYEKTAKEAKKQICAALNDKSSMKITVNDRIKAKSSLKKKLEKNVDKYHSLNDITDVLGFRIICYFVDDIGRISSAIEDLFDIDYDNSIDKRKLLNPNAFGYLSVHYVCSLKKTSLYDDALCDLRFEIQIRTLLQHVWAEIEHDLGYKSEFAIPRSIRRDFSRVAGLLELADEKFSSIKNGLDGYTDIVRSQIAENDVDEIYIDKISFDEYVYHNVFFKAYCDKFSEECGVEIAVISPELYLNQMTWLDVNTFGEFNEIIKESGDMAIRLMKDSLFGLELDIATSNVVLRSLCYAELLRRKYDKARIVEFLILSSPRESAERIADKLLDFKIE